MKTKLMNIPSWTPLWSKIVDSSIWDESDSVVKIFMTMMAIKDANHIVRCNAYELAKKSRKTEVEVLEALKILASPDTKRVEPQAYDGRRIQAVEGGWLILNGELYQEMMQKEAKRARDARAARAYRERRKKEGKTMPTAEEQKYVEIFGDKGKKAADDWLDAQQLKGGAETGASGDGPL